MNRSWNFDYIEEKLSILATRVELRGKLNILNFHIHSENFYLHLLNLLFDWKLENENVKLQNIPSIDLIDKTNKIFIQVSATNTKQKIENTLKGKILNNYQNYNFKFISISKDANELRNKTYANPFSINFNPQTDIFDVKSILNTILSSDIDKLRKLQEFIKKELGQETDNEKLDLNLTTVINVLVKENLNTNNSNPTINSFEIERKISHNNLKSASITINDYKIHYSRLDKIYTEFDKQGANKSYSVLETIRQEYVKSLSNFSDDQLFLKVKDNIIEKIMSSANFIKMPIDELELCVNILVVDAFIRCKIFENPVNYNYVNT